MGYSKQSLNERDTVYMLITDRFFDGDSSNNGVLGEEYRPGNLRYYQGGDWAGLRQKLPYIKRLGFTAIWMTAPQDNEKFSRTGDEAGYHGYYARDFNSPNPHFGTAQELEGLMAEAERLGLKVIIDAQLNHTADYLEYPSLTYDPPEYRPAPPFDDPAWYHNKPNIVDFDDAHEAQNYSLGGLDDLAQENPECWAALMAAYWEPETGSGWFSYGFAGSRVDAVVEIPPEYLALYEKHTGKPAFGEAFTGSVDENSAIQQYMWGMLDFPLYFQMNKVFCRSESWSNIKWVLDQDEKYKNAHRLFTFIDNHDRARFLANAGDDRAKLRMALAFLYAARGIPVVYYGTEQNMAGDLRYSEATLNTSNRQVMTSFDEGGETYIYMQRLNELRQAYPDVFVDGIQCELYFRGDDPVYAFCRRSAAAGDAAVCIFNNSPVTQSRTISLEMAGIKAGTLLTDLLDTSCVIRAQKKKAADAVTVDVTVPANSALLLISGHPAEYHCPAITQTKMVIHCDTGFGHELFVRGDTFPLSWERGIRCQNINADTWQFVTEEIETGSLEFKLLVDDIKWETGPDYKVGAGKIIEIFPRF